MHGSVEIDDADFGNRPFSLRLGGERRSEEAASQGVNEPASVHEEPPPDRPSWRDQAEGRPSGANLHQQTWSGLGLLVTGLAVAGRSQSRQARRDRAGPPSSYARCRLSWYELLPAAGTDGAAWNGCGRNCGLGHVAGD